MFNNVIIEPGRIEKNYWKDIWRYRELFYILSWRDIKVRYKQTVIGSAWSIIRPLATTIIFTIVFNKLAKFQSPGLAPYSIMVFCGMLPWQFFSNSISESGNSLTGNASLLTKVYFPRIIIPVSSLVTGMVDFAISFLLLIGMFLYYQFVPDVKILLLPVFILIVFLAALGAGMFISALNVKYRDFRYIVPFVIQIGLYITPVGFSSSIIPDKWKLLYYINPMAGVIDGFRWTILGEPLYWRGLVVSLLVTAFMLWFGLQYFRKTEKSFADNI